MNFKELGENLGLEEDEFIELVTLLVETSREDCERLHTAIVEGNASVIETSAHSIAGAAGNLGFMDIYDAAKEIENNLSVLSKEDMLSLAARITAAFERVSDMI